MLLCGGFVKWNVFCVNVSVPQTLNPNHVRTVLSISMCIETKRSCPKVNNWFACTQRWITRLKLCLRWLWNAAMTSMKVKRHANPDQSINRRGLFRLLLIIAHAHLYMLKMANRVFVWIPRSIIATSLNGAHPSSQMLILFLGNHSNGVNLRGVYACALGGKCQKCRFQSIFIWMYNRIVCERACCVWARVKYEASYCWFRPVMQMDCRFDDLLRNQGVDRLWSGKSINIRFRTAHLNRINRIFSFNKLLFILDLSYRKCVP